jgi:outer membrane biosynthesis protein TonB
MATASKKSTDATSIVKETAVKKVPAEPKKVTKKTAVVAAEKPESSVTDEVETAKKATKPKASSKKVASAEVAAVEAEVSKPKAAKTAKAPSTKKSTTKKTSVTPEQRYRMIADAAYFLAERRGFAGGYEMQDWISAEFQIDAKLTA